MNAGKDVYCEKPMVQLIDDGPEVIDAQKRTGRIMQVGTLQRVKASIVYQKAKELLEGGAIGELANLVEAWVDRNSAIGAWQYSIPPDASPSTIDWDRFLGRAPKLPFEPVRLFRWRNYPMTTAPAWGATSSCTSSPGSISSWGPSDRRACLLPAGCASGKTGATCRM